MAKYMNRTTPGPKQTVQNVLTGTQSESQGLLVQGSHDIQVNQVEIQGLILVQAALQAAIQAAIVILGTSNVEQIQQLQSISQTLRAAQFQSQSVSIVNSDGITVNQTEAQIEVAVQAAIQILAQLLVKLGG